MKKIILLMVTVFDKWLVMSLTPVILYMTPTAIDKGAATRLKPHPLHVSVTEINHNATEKTLEISCKMFTDDFEKALTQHYKTKIDLINPPDRPAMEKIVNDFIQKHLQLKADDKTVHFTMLGFEKDNDAIYSYFQVDNIRSVSKLGISNDLMHDMYTDQINLMHVIVGGTRKSVKLDYPNKDAVMNF